ncbi:PREDICTED: spermatogenesis-associated protein 1 [Miniopterus natalensis]|uniref:spermatogenesis-associated protein 1 n=1 Tax=Miniopterus natalensis TaxID=291302 RepID=UPI0007A6E2B2|nr:PREDICTED: spermatogenesis-associated protein 1 [Miniopterus natalensis]
MKKNKKIHQIPTDTYSIQTLVNLSLNPSRPSSSEIGGKEYIIFPDLTDFLPRPSQSAVFPGITEISLLQIEKQKIIKQLKQVKEERRHLERIREELTLQQYHACDSWKKKYFETKKVTASLEEILTKLQEDLELYYKKLLVQLEARQVKMRPRNMANITESKVRKQAISDVCTLKAELTQNKIHLYSLS